MQIQTAFSDRTFLQPPGNSWQGSGPWSAGLLLILMALVSLSMGLHPSPLDCLPLVLKPRLRSDLLK
jgi:hypothetical protein